ncbi:DEAD-domain-containing protein [Serendipita vermifera]|nr:DEAD-domain-containing protein [Serendipita vermifera]
MKQGGSCRTLTLASMADQTPTVKTKAKTRYLKAKKERRKQRRALVNASKARHSTKKEAEEGESSGDEDGDEEIVEKTPQAVQPLVADIEMQEEEKPVDEPKEKRKEKKSKKRLKKDKGYDEEPPDLEMAIESTFIDQDEVVPNDINEVDMVENMNVNQEIPSLESLSFPMPSQPAPISKAQLALQGMDKAMLDAEIIDPRKTERLNSDTGGTVTRLSRRMRKRLDDMEITELFAVQTALFPFLLPEDPNQRALYQPYNPPRDVCASAPTGSGKTLAYVVPIVEILSSRIVTRLRALVILPTRDLVQQVRETFEACCKGTKLQVASATGQHSFSQEQTQIVGNPSQILQGGSSKVDILVCTPGRLIDHLNATPNFTLQHLRFLVVDEADRLLTTSFQEWLKQVLTALRSPPQPIIFTSNDSSSGSLFDTFPVADGIAPSWMPAFGSEIDEEAHSSCQKLLFSATLTRDPAKIAELQLRNPKYFIVRERTGQNTGTGMDTDMDVGIYEESFETPATLREWMYVCEPSTKPLLLFHLTHKKNVSNALVFTKSTESTSRLMRLLEYFEREWSRGSIDGSEVKSPLKAEAFSSDLPPSQRKSILERFKRKEIDILVCSDLFARGMDIPHVSHVVNYDIPVDIRKYVHRVGRTARAGREGDAWSLVEKQEMHHFKTWMQEANHFQKIKKLRLAKDELAPLEGYYHVALKHLKEFYSRNAQAA